MYDDIVRILIVLAVAPFWIPVMRAIWNELNEGLRDEGGLFGNFRPRRPRQGRRGRRSEPGGSGLVHETIPGASARGPRRPGRPGSNSEGRRAERDALGFVRKLPPRGF